MNTPREILIAWASSEGFAAVHNGRATDAQIVDDLLKWLATHNLEIVSSSRLGQLDAIIDALNSVRKEVISAREIRTRSGDRPSPPSSDTAWNFPGMADFSSFRRSKSAP